MRLRTLLGISVFWLGLSALGDGFAALLVPARLATLAPEGGLATAIGGVTFFALLAGMVVQPLAGMVSDVLAPTVGRRSVLLGGAALTLLALAAFGQAGSVLTVLGVFVLIQITASVAQAAQQGLIPDLVHERWRGRAAGFKGLADVGGAFVAFLVLGVLLAQGDVAPALVFVGGVVAGTALLATILVRERHPGEPRDRAMRSHLVRGLGAYRLDLTADRPFIQAVVARFFFLLGIFAIGRFFLLFVAARLGVDPSTAADETGWLLAALTLATAVASVPFGWLADRLGRVPTMLAGAFMGAAGGAMLTIAPTTEAILAFGIVMALGSAAFSSANWAITADLAPSDQAARYMAIANFGTAGAAACAGLFGPFVDAGEHLAPGLGFVSLLIVSAGSMVVAGIVSAAMSVGRRPTPSPVPTPATTEVALNVATPDVDERTIQ